MKPSALQPYAIAALFVAAGAAHFVWPERRRLVEISGVFEILGGLGAAVPAMRRPAGWGLIALLVAVFPANVYMATAAARFAAIPAWTLYARLPLQLLLLGWIYETLVRRGE